MTERCANGGAKLGRCFPRRFASSPFLEDHQLVWLRFPTHPAPDIGDGSSGLEDEARA